MSDAPAADGCYWSVQDPEGAMLQDQTAAAPAAEQPATLGSQLADFLGSLF